MVPEHILVFPVILPATAGNELTPTLSVLGSEELHALFAVTEIVPLAAAVVALIELVVEFPVHPEGKVQVYEVAPGTAATLKVLVVPVQTVVFPEIAPGIAGAAPMPTDKVLGGEELQELFAVTEMVPPPEPALVVIVFVVEDPAQPSGNVQV